MNALPPLFLLSSLLLAGCTIGPDYQRPATPQATHYQAMPGWKTATPADISGAGHWWQGYADAELDRLLTQLETDNLRLASAEAQYRQARALAGGARAGLFPSLDLGAGMQRSGQGQGSAAQHSKSYDTNLAMSWEVDLWGKVRRELQAADSSAQASAAELAALRLSLQSELAQNYLQLRSQLRQRDLLEETAKAYQRALQMNESRYQAGLVSRADVSQAITQLRNTQAQAVELDGQIAQLRHAIAVLLGQTPGQLQLSDHRELPSLPVLRAELPSALLERRPDVAAAERRVMAANAQIGVAEAAYFPDFRLSASASYRSSQLGDWISAPNRAWSLGPQLALNLFDGGLLRSRVEQARAQYEQTVADYRQQVLQAIAEVEDQLVLQDALQREIQLRQQALDAARDALRLAENQYRAGTVDYLNVISAQNTALQTERTLIGLQGSLLISSVKLTVALGGDWSDQPDDAR